MSRPTWAVELSAADTDAAQALRLVPGVEARFSRDQSKLWLRGSEANSLTLPMIRQLPCLQRFSLLQDGRGIPAGKIVPTVNLSGSGWIPLRHLTKIEPPAALAAGSPPSAVPLRLVPTSSEAPAELLCAPFQIWHDYVIMAPAIRLEKLAFAVSDDRRALIHGTPLPSIPGQFFHVNHGIAIPSGFAFDPPIDHDLLAAHHRLNHGDLLLFHKDGSCEFVGASGMARASRSAVRETATALQLLAP